MEANIDPVEWRREIDRVEKLLEIAEYPEFLISGSQSESSCVNNLMNDDSVVAKLMGLGSYYEKIIHNPNLEKIRNKHVEIENELIQIGKFERHISSSVNVKSKVIEIV